MTEQEVRKIEAARGQAQREARAREILTWAKRNLKEILAGKVPRIQDSVVRGS